MRLLALTNLYPNPESPDRGVFVEHLMRTLMKNHEITVEAISPLPWFPFRSDIFGSYGAFARVPDAGVRDGIPVEYPRHLVIPKFGMNLTPWTMAWSLRNRIARRLNSDRDFDLINCHYLYPDGVAACQIGDALGKPVVLTAHGSDVNVIAKLARPGKLILRAVASAAAVITVSEALRLALCELGADAGKVVSVHNGVDLEMFAPVDRTEALRKLGLVGPLIVTVGNILEAKGQHLVVRAMEKFPDLHYLIVGTGPYEREVRNVAEAAGVSGRVHFAGRVPHESLAEIYGAADAMVLASAREGCPSVVLEAQACGTPVIATSVGGVPEIVGPDSGVVIDRRTPDAVAQGIREILARPPDRTVVRAWAERFSWDETARKYHGIFSRVLGPGCRS